jgi:hypothetical protein
VTDELTARRLVNEQSGRILDKKNGKSRRVNATKKAKGVEHD